MAFDFIVAELTCEVCGKTSPADTSTGMQTYIREPAHGDTITVGDAVDVSAKNLARAVYRRLHEGTELDPHRVRILETWECPHCHAPANWVALDVVDGVITSIAAVERAPASLAAADYACADVDV